MNCASDGLKCGAACAAVPENTGGVILCCTGKLRGARRVRDPNGPDRSRTTRFTRNRLLEAFCEDDWAAEAAEPFETSARFWTRSAMRPFCAGLSGRARRARFVRHKLMGLLTMRPSAVNARFRSLYAQSPRAGDRLVLPLLRRLQPHPPRARRARLKVGVQRPALRRHRHYDQPLEARRTRRRLRRRKR